MCWAMWTSSWPRCATCPRRRLEAVATALGIDPAIAADLLAEFTDLVLGELGDLAGEARAAFGAI